MIKAKNRKNIKSYLRNDLKRFYKTNYKAYVISFCQYTPFYYNYILWSVSTLFQVTSKFKFLIKYTI